MSTISSGTTSTTTLVHSGDTTGSLVFKTNDTGSGGTTAMTIDTSQRVGVNQATPVAPLDVSATQTLVSKFQGVNANGGYVYFQMGGSTPTSVGYIGSAKQLNTGGTVTDFGITATTNLVFGTNDGTERMRIDSSGNLLVGTTSAFSGGGGSAARLSVNQTSGTAYWTAYYQNTATTTPIGINVYYSGASPNTSGQTPYAFSDTGATRFYVNSNGGISNYSANNTNLSDQREKKNIEYSDNYLNKICQIPVKTFLYNDQTDEDKNLGVIAQDVQAICPELVNEFNWGTQEEPKMRLSVYQTDLQYALMKSIQELKALVDLQATEIAELKAKVG